MKRGAFILLEGVDRCGKTSQCKKLVEVLNGMGKPAVPMRFPDRQSAIGKMINAYLTEATEMNDQAIHLLFAANRWEKQSEILEALKEGKTLIVDRYSYSGVAFSAAKGLDLAWCSNPEVGLPKPDAVFYLDLPAEIAKTRGEYGQERYEKDEMQTRVRAMFDTLRKGGGWTVFDANQTIEDLHQELLDAAVRVIDDCSDTPVQTMGDIARSDERSPKRPRN